AGLLHAGHQHHRRTGSHLVRPSRDPGRGHGHGHGGRHGQPDHRHPLRILRPAGSCLMTAPEAMEPEQGMTVHEEGLDDAAEAGARRTWWKRFSKDKVAVGALAFLVLLALAAVLANWIAPYGPNTTNPSNKLAGPSWDHILGTDAFG